MNAYYARHYPHGTINRFLRTLDPQQAAELVLRPSRTDPPMRDLSPREITPRLRTVCPRDGAHIALDEHQCTAMVLDVDLTRPRPLHCSCADDGRLICDNCWVTMAGVLAGYVYMMKVHFGCTQLLACFSGGRGWHMFVIDAHHIDRYQAVQTLTRLVPDATRQLASAVQELHQRRPNTAEMVTLATFDLRRRLGRGDVARSVSLIDSRVIALYTDVMVPYFCSEWRPRVLGADTSVDVAINVAGALLQLTHPALAPAYQVTATAYEKMVRHGGPERKLSVCDRVDAFLAITALLWEAPDPGLASARHPIRLPWSPHERSQRFSLPLPLSQAHELCPASQPPRWDEVGSPDTTGDAWFRRSLTVMEDLLGDCQRTPSVLVWPT